MIRDPSDGSVRENQASTGVDEKPVSVSTRAELLSGDKPLMSSTTSGLPAASARDADRHKRSREWLADYHKIKPKDQP
jgi:hypothetical protein